MSRSRLRARQVLVALLALALGVLIFVLARGMPARAPEKTPEPPPTSQPASSTPLQSEAADLAPAPTVDLTKAAIDRPSLPRQWAAAVIEQAIEHLTGVSQTARADFVWLSEEALWGPLYPTRSGAAIGGQALVFGSEAAIEVVAPGASEPGELSSLGHIDWRDDTLTLRQPLEGGDRQSVRTLTGGVSPGDALRALADEAEARGVVLVAAYWEMPGKQAILALVEVRPVTASFPIREPTPGPSPVPTLTASPTLTYQSEIFLTLEAGLVPLIEALPREASTGFAETHARSGTLTWEAGGPRVADRPLNIDPDTAHRLTVFGLSEDGSTLLARAILSASWDGNGTVVESEGTEEWYYGFRLLEVIHGMVAVAEEHGGQLEVTYDDVGAYHALTVIDFQPLPLPPSD
jgi:hypothetical protein